MTYLDKLREYQAHNRHHPGQCLAAGMFGKRCARCDDNSKAVTIKEVEAWYKRTLPFTGGNDANPNSTQ